MYIYLNMHLDICKVEFNSNVDWINWIVVTHINGRHFLWGIGRYVHSIVKSPLPF